MYRMHLRSRVQVGVQCLSFDLPRKKITPSVNGSNFILTWISEYTEKRGGYVLRKHLSYGLLRFRFWGVPRSSDNHSDRYGWVNLFKWQFLECVRSIHTHFFLFFIFYCPQECSRTEELFYLLFGHWGNRSSSDYKSFVFFVFPKLFCATR